MPESHKNISGSAKLGPVHLRVTDIARTSRLWLDVVGLVIIGSSEQSCDLGVAGKTLISLHGGAASPAVSKSVGLFHLALELPSLIELARVMSRLQRAGYSPVGQDHLAAESIYFSDPDGNAIELYFSTPERARVEMVDGRPHFFDQNNVLHSGVELLDMSALMFELDRYGEGNGMLPGETRVGHIHLRSNTPETMMQFYTTILGFKPHIDSASFGMFDCGTEVRPHMIAFNTWGGRTLPRASECDAGLAGYTVEVTEADFQAVKVRLSGKAVKTKHGTGFLCDDPDGNWVHVISTAA